MHCNELMAFVYAGANNRRYPFNYMYMVYCWRCGHTEKYIDEVPPNA